MEKFKPSISPYLFSLIPIAIVLITLVGYANVDIVQQKIERSASIFSFPHLNVIQCVIQVLGF